MAVHSPVKVKIIGGDPVNGTYLGFVADEVGVGEIFTLCKDGITLNVLDGRFQDVGCIVDGCIAMFFKRDLRMKIGNYDGSSGAYFVTPYNPPGEHIDRRERVQMHPLDFLVEKWLERREREED